MTTKGFDKSINCIGVCKLTNEIECLLKILLDILMGRIAGRYLHILQALQVTFTGTLAGNVEDTIGAHAAGIVRIASIAQQQMWKYWRSRMCFDICNGIKTKYLL